MKPPLHQNAEIIDVTTPLQLSNPMKTTSSHVLLTVTALLLAALSTASAAVIYSDNFSGNSTTNLAGQTTTVGGGTWIGSPAWKADGSIAGKSSPSANGDAMYLPFTPVSDRQYTLSLTTVDTSAIHEWFALGFANFASTPTGTEQAPWVSPTDSSNTWTAWMLNRAGGNGTTFLHNVVAGVDYAALGHDLKIVLDTATAGWTAEYFVNGASIRGPVALGVSSANYVMFGMNNGAGYVDNFQLSVNVVPEPSAALLGGLGLLGLLLRRRRNS